MRYLILLAFLSQNALATLSTTDSGAVSTAPVPVAAPATSTIPTAASTASNTAAPAINSSAKQGGSSQMMGGLISGAVGAGLIIYAQTDQSAKSWAYPMAAMALMQALTSLMASGSSGKTGDASSGWNDNTLPPGSSDLQNVVDPNTGLTPAAVDGIKKANDGIAFLTSKGYKFDPVTKSVTTPDGTVVPASALASPAAMAAAGFSSGAISASGATLDKLTKDALARIGNSGPNVVPVAIDSGEGGGGGGGSAAGSDDALNDYLRRLNKPLTAQQKADFIAGKSILLDGEPIGVKGDNIFEMIHRAYQRKRAAGEFIEVVEAQPQRAMTSLKKQPVGFTPRKR